MPWEFGTGTLMTGAVFSMFWFTVSMIVFG